MNPYGPDGRRRPQRGFYRRVGDGASKAVQGAYRNVNAGAKEAVGAARKAGDKVASKAQDLKQVVADARPSERISEAFDGTLNYLGGKPTAIELSDQFNIALSGNQAAAIALRMLPATAAVGTVVGLGNILFGGDTLANKGMDTLGMGAGIFGMHSFGGVGGTTPAGRALRYTGGATLGKIGSDLIQLAAGGGQSQTDQQLAEALIALQGGRG